MELPQDFTRRIRSQLGDACDDFLACYEKERAYGLRCNPLKIEEKKLRLVLLEKQIETEQVPWAAEGFYYSKDVYPGKLPLHEAGAYYIQEPSAMIAVSLLDPQPGERILDLCAAPGGKSTQIAGRMLGQGLLVSNEVVAQRARILSRNIERMGVRNAVVLNETPKRLAERFPLYFDRILVDAPCSGEGMFRKDIQARGEWSLEQVEICAKRQRDILEKAASMLKPGGILVYSTCTFAPQENEQNAEWFVRQYPQFELQRQEQIWPHLQRGEGHFAARFYKKHLSKEETAISPACERTADTAKKQARKKNVRKSDTDKAAGYEQLQEFCTTTLSEEMCNRMRLQISSGQLAVFGDQLYLLPAEIRSLDGLKAERAGLHLGCCKKRRFEPAHALAMALRPEDVTQTAETEEPERFLRGETTGCGDQKGWTLVTTDGCSAGWGKASQGVLKNHYPKGLRRN